MSSTILIVEDESGIADNIVYALQTEGFSTVWHPLGQAGLDALKAQPFDLVILDVGLPDISGFEICKKIRGFSEIPIIFLTARSEEIDRVVGLEIGGDDYIAKPFSPRELVARVKVILKRSQRQPAESTVVARNPQQSSFHIDEAKARIYYQQQLLSLTRYEYLILLLMIKQPERVFSREQLMQAIFEVPQTRLERAIDTHIKALRAKLRVINAEVDPIKTHRGLGYSIACD